ncbi:MAG: hypothetical protein KGJ23_14420 [Euryarchaeota archaeon]|nr:hypothetical protein [Euryarchaeota archaeon]MDE1882033.1 hypothetical protein [Euryarchaeota archaeon]MDE2046178.1 hypothetical protein [Thermoplasmata archaeon]
MSVASRLGRGLLWGSLGVTVVLVLVGWLGPRGLFFSLLLVLYLAWEKGLMRTLCWEWGARAPRLSRQTRYRRALRPDPATPAATVGTLVGMVLGLEAFPFLASVLPPV